MVWGCVWERVGKGRTIKTVGGDGAWLLAIPGQTLQEWEERLWGFLEVQFPLVEVISDPPIYSSTHSVTERVQLPPPSSSP